jgi:membrane-associated phospholipid phosphatase
MSHPPPGPGTGVPSEPLRGPSTRHRRARCRLAGGVAATMTAATCALAGRSSVAPAEERLFRLLNDAPAALWPVLWPIMQLGNLAAPAAVGAAAALTTRRWRPVVAVVGSGYAAWAAAQLLKHAVGRARPTDLLPGVVLRERVDGAGFVSGHAAISAAIAGALWPHVGTRGRVAAAGLAGVVGAGRMFVGAHLPLDVVGGQAIGALVALGVATAVAGTDRAWETGAAGAGTEIHGLSWSGLSSSP